MEKITKTEELEIVAKYLGNLNLLRTFTQKQAFDRVERAYNNMMTAYMEREELFKQEQKEAAEQEEKRRKMIEYIQSQGFNVEDLISPITVRNKLRTVENKYSFTDSQGKTQYWKGSGRMPKELKALIEQGHTLEEYLIKP